MLNRIGVRAIETMATERMMPFSAGVIAPMASASRAIMKENSPICARLTAVMVAMYGCCRAISRIRKMMNALPNTASTNNDPGERRRPRDDRRIDQHAERDEKEHAENIPQREHLRQRGMAEERLADDQPGEKCPQRKGKPQRGTDQRAPQRQHHDGGEKISRDPVEEAHFRMTGAIQRANTIVQSTNRMALTRLMASEVNEMADDFARIGNVLINTTASKSCTTEMPSAMRPKYGMKFVVFPQQTHQHHGTAQRHRIAQHDIRAPGQPESPAQPDAQQDHQQHLRQPADDRRQSALPANGEMTVARRARTSEIPRPRRPETE